jgi:hypothetical protein
MTMDSLERPQDGTTGTYIIRLSAERTMVGHTVLLRVPDVLTANAASISIISSPPATTGTSFSNAVGSCGRTSSATHGDAKQLIAQAVNTNDFRRCIVTLFHGRKDTSDSDDATTSGDDESRSTDADAVLCAPASAQGAGADAANADGAAQRRAGVRTSVNAVLGCTN